MLRLWRDKLFIGLSPERVTLVRGGTGLRPALRAKLSLPVPAGEGGWKPSMDLLTKTLQADKQWQNVDARVILANSFVRYQLIPWSENVSSSDERELYVRESFTQVYGDAAANWAYTMSEVARGAAWFCCAVDRELLSQLETVMLQSGSSLQSVVPHVMTAFNGIRKLIKTKNCWFVQIENDKLLLGLIQNGHWLTLSSRQIQGDAWQRELPLLLEREWRVHGMSQVPREVVITAPEAKQAALDGEGKWVFHWLRTSLPYGLSGRADAAYAMAMGA